MSENYKLSKSRSLGVFYHVRKHLNCTTSELTYIQALDERKRKRERERAKFFYVLGIDINILYYYTEYISLTLTFNI